jgi:hypothetical protein
MLYRLYICLLLPLCQVVPPSLVGRAALFGQRLDLPPNWHILDAPYFAAPGLNSTSTVAAQGPRGHTSGGGGGGHCPAVGDNAVEGGSGDGFGRGGSLPSLPDISAQRRLSSSNETDTGAAAAVPAAMAAMTAAGDGSSAALQQQQQGSSLARLQSCSTHGGQQYLTRTSTSASQQQQQQQQGLQVPAASPTALAASSSSNTESLLVLRAASLQLNVAPSVLMAAAARGDRRGTGGQRARMAGPARPLFPPVTILFAAVEGSGDLLRFPALARCVLRCGRAVVRRGAGDRPCSGIDAPYSLLFHAHIMCSDAGTRACIPGCLGLIQCETHSLASVLSVAPKAPPLSSPRPRPLHAGIPWLFNSPL